MLKLARFKMLKNFRAKLHAQPFADLVFFEDGKIPSGQPRADVRVSADVAKESAGGRRGDERGGIEPLAGFTEDYAAREVWIQERPHGIACVAGIGWVVAELRRKRKAGLRGDHAGD